MADQDFDDISEFTVGWESGWDPEGGLHTDPNDRGGTTRWGIAQASHPDVDVTGLDRETAMGIYRDQYWEPVKKMVPSRMTKLRKAMFDAYVNGQRHAVRSLQEVIGAERDGAWGPNSEASLGAAMERHDDQTLYDRFMRERSNDYRRIAEGQHPHLKGWLKRLSALDGYISAE